MQKQNLPALGNVIVTVILIGIIVFSYSENNDSIVEHWRKEE
jgi:hypothetical protein